MCAKEDIGPQNADAKTVEANANAYASQLVLPDYLVLPRIEHKPVSLDSAEALRKDFKSSLTAAAIKLVRKATIPSCVVRHSQSKREWFVTNLAFPFGLYVAREMHAESDGFALLYGAGGGMTRARREPANRWLSGPGVFAMSVLVQSVKESLNKSSVYLSEVQRFGAQQTRTGDENEEQTNDAGRLRV